MREAVHHCFSEGGGADIYISAAAISDFAPKRYQGKIPSGKKTRLELEPLPKLLDEVIRDYAPVTVAFKLGTAPEKQSKQMLAEGSYSGPDEFPQNHGQQGRGIYAPLMQKDRNN